MTHASDIAQMTTAVQGLLSEKFGMRRRALPKMMQRAGRRLPKRMHAKAQVLIDAGKLTGNPKLLRQMDAVKLAQAFAGLTEHLEAIDVAKRRRDRLLRMTGLIAFYILLITACFVWWLWWRGYV